MSAGSEIKLRGGSAYLAGGYDGGGLTITSKDGKIVTYQDGGDRRAMMKMLRTFSAEELITMILDFVDNMDEG